VRSFRRLTLTPRQFGRLSCAGLLSLALIVLTGAAVRLTDSGLGCPDWPRCYGKPYPPLSAHALIEFGNRVFSGIVGLIAVAVFLLAFRRRPYRRDLALLAATLPLGVLAQAVLGGFTVRDHLAPGFVMAHFGLSMVVLVGAFALAWRATREPGRGGSTGRSNDRLGVWSVRALLPLAALTIFAGTAATAAGPHSGAASGQRVHRLTFKGTDTLSWVVHRHATIAALFGVAVVGAWLVARRRDSRLAVEQLTVLGILVAAQGLVGSVQYELRLPADMVWVHVALATATWVAVLWSVAAAGRLAPRRVAADERLPGRARAEPLAPAPAPAAPAPAVPAPSGPASTRVGSARA
jgi:cytochrome c oxidase assembly protein subunit 15